MTFALLQRWRGSNCPVLVQQSISAQQVRLAHASPPLLRGNPGLNLQLLTPCVFSGACVVALGH
jgi:hypothetical protein